MKTSFMLTFLVLVAIGELAADDNGKLIFEDSFERTESQEKTDEPGKGWGTNSKSRAKNTAHVETIVDLRRRMDEWKAKVKPNADKKSRDK